MLLNKRLLTHYVFCSILFLILGVNLCLAQTLNKKLIFKNVEREYFIHLPKNLKDLKSVPLLLAFHGAGDLAYMFMYYSKFNQMADKDGYIVIYPQGVKQKGRTGWNVRLTKNEGDVDDVAFIENLINVIGKKYKIDHNRIYVAGMSNGGFMSFLLGCKLSDKITAVASVTGSMTPNMIEGCKPQKVMPILQIHGTNDKAVPYLGQKKWSSPIKSVIEHWVDVNQLSAKPKRKKIPDRNKADGSYVEKYTYKGKVNKSRVIHYKVINGGHDWFGNRGNMDINTSKIIWNFFSKFKS